jgi:uncharacterized protein DUF2249
MLFPRNRHCLELFQGKRRDPGGRCAMPSVDLRALSPPEPLLRILDALEHADAGPHEFLLDREPVFLYPMLAGQGWRHATSLDERGYLLTIYRAKP